MAATITTLPTPPSRTAPAVFSERADAFLGALPTFVTEANALAVEVSANASTASSGASTATTQAANAAASAASAAVANTATMWVSGTTYTTGQGVWSPLNYLAYRRKTNGAGTTDPSLDTTNWAALSAPIPPSIQTYQSLGGI